MVVLHLVLGLLLLRIVLSSIVSLDCAPPVGSSYCLLLVGNGGLVADAGDVANGAVAIVASIDGRRVAPAGSASVVSCGVCVLVSSTVMSVCANCLSVGSVVSWKKQLWWNCHW